jgi:hypothetical protein
LEIGIAFIWDNECMLSTAVRVWSFDKVKGYIAWLFHSKSNKMVSDITFILIVLEVHFVKLIQTKRVYAGLNEENPVILATVITQFNPKVSK